MNKLEKMYKEILEMMYWAEEQKHINWEQRDLLIDNIIKIKKEIDAENND